MKKILSVLLLLLILVGCSPHHQVEFDLIIDNDHAGTFRLSASVDQNEDEEYDLPEIKEKLDKILAQIDNYQYGTSVLELNDEKQTIQFTYEETFENLKELNEILNRFSDDLIEVKIMRSDNILINQNKITGLDIDESIFFKEIYVLIKEDKTFGLINSNDIESYQEADYTYELLLENNVEKAEEIYIHKPVQIYEIDILATLNKNNTLDLSFEHFIDPEDKIFNFKDFKSYASATFKENSDAKISFEKTKAGFKVDITNYDFDDSELLNEIFGFTLMGSFVQNEDESKLSQEILEVIKANNFQTKTTHTLTLNASTSDSFLDERNVDVRLKVDPNGYEALMVNDSKIVDAFMNKDELLEIKGEEPSFKIELINIENGQTILTQERFFFIISTLFLILMIILIARKKETPKKQTKRKKEASKDKKRKKKTKHKAKVKRKKEPLIIQEEIIESESEDEFKHNSLDEEDNLDEEINEAIDAKKG